MKSIVFFDLEVDPNTKTILDLGAINNDGRDIHSKSIRNFEKFIQKAQFIGGHNIIHHDLIFLERRVSSRSVIPAKKIDTLFFSPLLFPQKPYHRLVKDDKLRSEERSNPLNDSKKAQELFWDECNAFNKLEEKLKAIFYCLLKEQKEFKDFFEFVGYQKNQGHEDRNIVPLITGYFQKKICSQTDLDEIIRLYPIPLSYALALINCRTKYSIPPAWVIKTYPQIEKVLYLLRGNPCLSGCVYCDEALDVEKGLSRYFGFDAFRKYEGEDLQKQAAQSAIESKSLLAIFPTGGGKSIAFQVPALMEGENMGGLTVIISPLQSLMKDQVDNLEERQITEAVTLNGLLDPIERQKSLERVQDGSAALLYISPESLRSKTMTSVLLGRKIVRFVIDEAHCFSTWGQDFRVDYLYIGEFIKSLQEKKKLNYSIPISCFTATAKKQVIEDIKKYFKDKLGLSLELFRSTAPRTNLNYRVFEKNSNDDKYSFIRDLIQEREHCPTIVYVSTTKGADELARRLNEDGFEARSYHGKMKAEDKKINQDLFIGGEVPIIVATSAFGMGVDKKDVGLVIHYQISDSLENYVQEAGRAGRDESITADCFVLFNEDDLDKHFVLLNQTKLHLKEIKQIWRSIKELAKPPSYRISKSALEIARKAGWDEDARQVESQVRTAISSLEKVGYVKRGQNMPRVYADSLRAKTAREAVERVSASNKFTEAQKIKANRIISKLFTQKHTKNPSDEEAESRVDYIADLEGIPVKEVIEIVTLLREEKILDDHRDLTAFIRKEDQQNKALKILKQFLRLEQFLLETFLERWDEAEKIYSLKELNELAEKKQCFSSLKSLKTVFNFWAIKNWIKKQGGWNDKVMIRFNEKINSLKDKLKKRIDLTEFIIDYLFDKTDKNNRQEEELIGFSILELKVAFEEHRGLLKEKTETTIQDIEDSLFYLQRIEAIKIEGGFLVIYNRLMVERLEKDNKRQYTQEDYEPLKNFYENKVRQIHIVGEYARRMLKLSEREAWQYVADYFELNTYSFLNKYFRGAQEDLKRNITRHKYQQLFGDLSDRQREIIDDKENKYIVVAAGPGSGKTKVLVHKLAALYLMENVKHEQFLTLTFSRAAATEFKKRLITLIGGAAFFIDIKTFHSYAFDLLGQIGDLEKIKEENGRDVILRQALKKIETGEVEKSKITKMVLVIDEAQDMSADEFDLVKKLMEKNEDMRVIAVGDDDQNIYEFRGSSSKYFQSLITEQRGKKYELLNNYRSKKNLVEFTNQFVKYFKHRLKDHFILSHQEKNGQIKIIRYLSSHHLITPLVSDVLKNDLSGTTGILTQTNQEALQITGLLLQKGQPAKLIEESKDSFSLYHLLEIRFFIQYIERGQSGDEKVEIIDDENWEMAKRSLKNEFEKSSKLELCFNLIQDFEKINRQRKYKSDLKMFIKESRMEDFFNENGETIFVSTMYKAKGKEFDNVFILLNNFSISEEEKKRVLYVAMTRAKNHLVIHLNDHYLNNMKAHGCEKIDDDFNYSAPKHLVEQLNHRDVYLSYFKDKQRQCAITELKSGEEIKVKGDKCVNSREFPILKFSKKFLEDIEKRKKNNFSIKTVRINFILFWQGEDMDKEIRIILPVIYWQSFSHH